jgi:NAD-dependent protein deacetylase/lipoamidase
MTDLDRQSQPLAPPRCAELLRRCRAAVALTGAGISTAAGIPDFRGPQGLYVTRRYDLEKVFEIDWFRRAPEYFYNFSSDFIATVRDLHPTFTHHFLAGLEREGRLSGVVTQNIDMLHQQAGSRNVVELHGSYASATCSGCDQRHTGLSYRWWQQAMLTSPTPPIARCPACNGILKPDIVFFGELVSDYDHAEELVGCCDLLLVIGSSLQVTPASYLTYQAEATTVVVNRGAVALPPAPQRYFVAGDIDDYFREVAAELGLG